MAHPPSVAQAQYGVPRYDNAGSAKCFDEDKWIAVLDTERCEHSREQHAMIKDQKMKTAVLYCNDHRDAEICKRVYAFPAFCNLERKQCMYGLRSSKRELEESCRALRAEEETAHGGSRPATMF